MRDALKDQVIIVFGATGRVGEGVCTYLAEQGAVILAHYCSNQAKAEKIVQTIVNAGGRAQAIQADVTDPAAVHACLARVVERWGRIDGVVNQIHRDKEFKPTSVAEMEWTNWESHIEAMKAHFLICKEVIPYMRRQHYGRIVYVSGGLSFRFFEGCSPFSAAKAGMNAFCKTLALEEGKNGITVNVIAPGKIAQFDGGAENPPTLWQDLERRQLENNPIGRFCTPKDVASAAMVFLLKESGYLTGQTLFLAGGEIMPMP